MQEQSGNLTQLQPVLRKNEAESVAVPKAGSPVFSLVLCGLTSPLPSEDLGTKILDLGSGAPKRLVCGLLKW